MVYNTSQHSPIHIHIHSYTGSRGPHAGHDLVSRSDNHLYTHSHWWDSQWEPFGVQYLFLINPLLIVVFLIRGQPLYCLSHSSKTNAVCLKSDARLASFLSKTKNKRADVLDVEKTVFFSSHVICKCCHVCRTISPAAKVTQHKFQGQDLFLFFYTLTKC